MGVLQLTKEISFVHVLEQRVTILRKSWSWLFCTERTLMTKNYPVGQPAKTYKFSGQERSNEWKYLCVYWLQISPLTLLSFC